MGKHERRRRREHETDEGGSDSGGGGHARKARIEELIREELGLLLRSEIRDPRLDGVEITMVDLTGDGSCARIWFSPRSEDEGDGCARALEGASGFLRSDLARSLGLKRTPELRFRRDRVTRALADIAAERDHSDNDNNGNTD